jgi:hypothetical protein
MTSTMPQAPASTMTSADGVAKLLPPLATLRDMTAVDTVAMAAAVKDAATELAWDGVADVESACDLRRRLHALASVVAQQSSLPPRALIDIDTATRLVERAAVGAVVDAQQAGQLFVDDVVAVALLGPKGPELYRLHGLTDWTAFAEALDDCRGCGVVTFSALRERMDGTVPVTQPAQGDATPAEQAPQSPDWVQREVRGVLTDVRTAAESARGVAVRDVDTLDQAVAADLARELWDQMLVCTALYSALHRRGRSR